MAKFEPANDPTFEGEAYLFHCPGCRSDHWVRVSGPEPCWLWNEKPERPTVSPSIMVNRNTKWQCHSFITDGKIQFLGDCWHDLKGKTVELPDWESI
jgi:hypothetical protein